MKRLSIAALLVAVGCGDTGQPHVNHPAVAIGTPAHAITSGAWSVTLEVARIGFGPTIFCASRSASEDLCSSSLAEIAAVAPVDLLSATPQPLGRVDGFVDTVRSTGFDYALPWFATDDEPRVTSAAPGGHSIHLEGKATSSAKSFRFVIDADVTGATKGRRGVYFAPLDTNIDENTKQLEVRFDPNRWLDQVDFDDLGAAGTDPVVVAPDARAANAIVVAATSLAVPVFTWSR
ncbi:MAG: hypothetical protein ACXWUG_01300 [Polyangiales bacterium]